MPDEIFYGGGKQGGKTAFMKAVSLMDALNTAQAGPLVDVQSLSEALKNSKRSADTKEAFDDFQEWWGSWADAQFTRSTPKSIMAHALREAVELNLEIQEYLSACDEAGDFSLTVPENVLEEMADVFMLFLHLCHKQKRSLFDVIKAKAEVCMKREWAEPDAEGVCEHVRTPEEVYQKGAEKWQANLPGGLLGADEMVMISPEDVNREILKDIRANWIGQLHPEKVDPQDALEALDKINDGKSR